MIKKINWIKPDNETPYDKLRAKSNFKKYETISDAIKIKFKKIGAAAAAANLFSELRMPAKKDDKLTNAKKGKVILVKSTANLNFSSISEKPGAINFIKLGIKISTNTVRLKRANTNKLNTVFANFCAFVLLDISSDV